MVTSDSAEGTCEQVLSPRKKFPKDGGESYRQRRQKRETAGQEHRPSPRDGRRQEKVMPAHTGPRESGLGTAGGSGKHLRMRWKRAASLASTLG